MARKDKITIKILPDGRIVATTGRVSAKNHIEAADILRELTDLMGGEAEITEREKKEEHHHHNREEEYHKH